jgi:acylglycerol lipase
MIEPSIRTLAASDGCQIHFRHWRSPMPRGIVIAMHGIQSHSGWYEASSRTMAEAGFDVYFGDRRGSGLNEFQRGHAAHGMRLIHDVIALNELARHDHRDRLPVTLLGLSWGGKIAAATAALFPGEFDGLALLYPGLKPRIRPNLWQRFRLHLARCLEITKNDIPIPLRAPRLFTDSLEWQQFIANDALALHSVTSSLLNAGNDLDGIVAIHSKDIRCPVLLMLAGRDQIINNPKTRILVTRFGTNHLTCRTYPEACHTLEFEGDRVAIFSDLTEWLENMSPAVHDRNDCR